MLQEQNRVSVATREVSRRLRRKEEIIEVLDLGFCMFLGEVGEETQIS